MRELVEIAKTLGFAAAWIAHLIGVDPDFRLHVSGHLLDLNNGPTLEALKRLDCELIRLPTRVKDRSDRDRLALRSECFKAMA